MKPNKHKTATEIKFAWESQNKILKDFFGYTSSIWRKKVLEDVKEARKMFDTYMGVPIVKNTKCLSIRAKLQRGTVTGHYDSISNTDFEILCWEALINGHKSREVLDQLEQLIVVGETGGLWFTGYEDNETYGPYHNMETLEAALILYAEAYNGDFKR